MKLIYVYKEQKMKWDILKHEYKYKNKNSLRHELSTVVMNRHIGCATRKL